MIDLHCHMLPGIDDGSPDLKTSLAMAAMASEDGIEHLACTPHITPGLYGNTGPDIVRRTDELQLAIEAEGIPLTVWPGADIHVHPQLVARLGSGEAPTLAGSRYFLLEPPHHVLPPRLDDLVKRLLSAGYVPIITHPERLTWAEAQYEFIVRLASLGALVQVTAASVTGGFGRTAKALSDRLIDDGLVDIVATDAHNVSGRPPVLSEARDALAERIGEAEALEMVHNRPARVLRNEPILRRSQQIAPHIAATR